MRPHRLSLTAFGPFGGTQHVDFDALCADGLFLLHGETGAGKTSLLDAVCFALYGGVPGSRQQPGGTLRSDHAPPGTLTEVVLDVTLAGRRLEITRRPEQWRPKKTGTGTTRERAYATLREHLPESGEWRPLSRSHQEIGVEIAELLGMSRDQFCQVALLPQGDFARFLRAGAEDRAKLLGRLFHTGRFAAIEDELTGMRKETQSRVRHADEELLALAQRMRQAAGPDSELDAFTGAAAVWEGSGSGGRRRDRDTVPDQRTAEPSEADSGTKAETPGLSMAVLTGAALARAHAREWCECAASAARAAEERHTEAVRRLEESRELARRQQRHAVARQRLQRVRASESERRHSAECLERARAADAVTPLLALRTAASAEDRAARTAERNHRAALPTELAAADPALLDELASEARQQLGGLDAARHAERRVTAIDQDIAEIDAESQRADETLREAQDWLSDWETTRQAHQRRVERAADAATRAEHLAGRLEPARRRLSAARRRDQLQGESQEARATLLAARERASVAYERWLELKDRRLRGIAAELATRLQPGVPCAVCGNAEHPAPARRAEGYPEQSVEDDALTRHREAEREREDAEQQVRTLEEQLTLSAAECGDLHEAELTAEVERLTTGHETARAEAADAHAARERLEQAEAEHQRRTAQQHAAQQRAAARTSRREALAHERAALTEQLGQAAADAGSIAERATALEQHAGLLTEAAQSARTAHDTAKRLAQAEKRLVEAAGQAGFSDGEEAAKAVLDEPTRQEIQRRLEAWQVAEQAARTELADEELVEAAATRDADPQGEEARVAAATTALREASAVQDAALSRCGELDRLSEQASRQVRRHAPLRTAHGRVSALAQLANGTSTENERRMRLETYVLAARLEQVAAAASVRLSRMSAGRYTLVHSAERTQGRGRSGLGLHVVDAWTGRERDTATLSGGESFFASLALALGLADVVTEEAGGTPLDTLFIDEGFGSLDQDTLEEVLDVLDSLREQDRSVGIVSHVAELRSRIPEQLQVLKTREGSSVRRRTAPSGR